MCAVSFSGSLIIDIRNATIGVKLWVLAIFGQKRLLNGGELID